VTVVTGDSGDSGDSGGQLALPSALGGCNRQVWRRIVL
jgi:hypothetical protein